MLPTNMELLNLYGYDAEASWEYSNTRKWKSDDEKDKRFIRIFKMDKSGKLEEIDISELIIGEPAMLQLEDGDIVATSEVLEWSRYGRKIIRTKSRLYYYL